MSVLKKLASETALYGVSSILGRVIYWFLVPLHTYVFLRPGELSSNTELFSWVALFNVIYTFGMETAYFRFANRSPEHQQAYFNQALTAISTVSLIFSGVLILLAPAMSAWLNYPGEASNIVYLALIVAIDAIVAIPFARLRLEKKARLFVKIKIINILLNVALNVFFLLLCRDIALGKYLPALQPLGAFLYRPDIGPGYIFIANLVANAGFLVMLRGAFKGFRWTWGGEVWREMWVYAYPILILGLAGVANQMADRWFLRHLLPKNFYSNLTPEDALGIYGNCYKLSVFMSLAIQSFKYAADPFFFSKAEDKNAPALLASVMKWFVIVCVVLWVGVSLNLDLLGSVMLSPAYRVGLVVVPILLLANLFVGVYYNLAFWFKLTDKTQYGTLITFIGAGLTVLLNLWWIPQMGYLGCAWAFLVSSVVMCAICYVLGEKHYPVPYHLGSALGYIGSAGLLIYLASFVKISNLWVSVPYHLALCLMYLLGILVIERDSIPLRFRQKIKILG
ncbi:MAG: polysaccharide biosynthesis C-terminal domain-containing protein [Spirosomaceae bacterium]|jgi:O-antigen/teichoic acid export membrane protein|nr:polysaccharide biosynthesis C-terminal domain-containing protein [Spirosomataceae bacterium]